MAGHCCFFTAARNVVSALPGAPPPAPRAVPAGASRDRRVEGEVDGVAVAAHRRDGGLGEEAAGDPFGRVHRERRLQRVADLVEKLRHRLAERRVHADVAVGGDPEQDVVAVVEDVLVDDVDVRLQGRHGGVDVDGDVAQEDLDDLVPPVTGVVRQVGRRVRRRDGARRLALDDEAALGVAGHAGEATTTSAVTHATTLIAFTPASILPRGRA